LRFPLADRFDSLRDGNLERRLRTGLVIEIGNGHARQLLLDRRFDATQIVLFLRRDECERIACRFSTRGAAHAVDVILRYERHVEVHDVTQFLHVDAPGGDVSGHKNAHGAVLERRQRRGALGLRSVSVNPIGADLVPDQKIRQPRCSSVSNSEDFNSCDTG
jgi:hypothetical protein